MEWLDNITNSMHMDFKLEEIVEDKGADVFHSPWSYKVRYNPVTEWQQQKSAVLEVWRSRFSY